MIFFKRGTFNDGGRNSIIFFRTLIGFNTRVIRYLIPLFLIFLGWSNVAYGLLYSVSGYLTTGAIVILGYVTDIQKRKFTLIVGLGVSSLSLLSFYFASMPENQFWMIATYSIFGLSGSLARLSLTTILADLSESKDEKTKSFSFMAFFWNMTGVVAPLAGGGLLAFFNIFTSRKGAYLALLLTVAVFLFLTMLFALKFPLPDPTNIEVREQVIDDEWQSFEETNKKSISFQLGAFFLCEAIMGFTSGIAIPFLNRFIIEEFNLTDFVWSIVSALGNIGIALGSLLMLPLTKWMGNEKSLGILHIVVPILALGIALSTNFYVITMFYVLRGSTANMSRPAWNSFFYGWLPPEFRGTSTGFVSAGRRLTRSIGTQVGSYIYSALAVWTFPIAMIGYPIAILIPIMVQWFIKSKNNENTSSKYSASEN